MIGAGGTLVIATRNKGKTEEFRQAFRRIGIQVKDLHEMDGIPDIEETGTTFADNALLKAKAVADITGLPALADDSGLCVDALGGAPGVYSARYAGEEATDGDNIVKLLRELEAAAGSGDDMLSPARFVCALALYDPAEGSHLQAEGAVEGFILRERRGTGGFGYDPVFWLPAFGRSMAQLTLEEKNGISHRAEALKKLLALVSD